MFQVVSEALLVEVGEVLAELDVALGLGTLVAVEVDPRADHGRHRGAPGPDLGRAGDPQGLWRMLRLSPLPERFVNPAAPNTAQAAVPAVDSDVRLFVWQTLTFLSPYL